MTNIKCTKCGCTNVNIMLTHRIFKFLCAVCYMKIEGIKKC